MQTVIVRSAAAAIMVVHLAAATAQSGDEQTAIQQDIDRILAVDKKGQNHESAQAATQRLRRQSADALIPILKGIRGANPLAANWLRGAFESIAAQEIESGHGLPTATLRPFILDRQNAPQARRLAYEWLIQVKPELEAKLLADMLEDPSPEFRRDAVAQVIDQADAALENGQPDAARELYQQALTGAVDDDQVKAIVGPLKKLGVQVDLQRHFGFLTQWKAIGPFDNRELKGFDAVYAPEQELNLNATYDGQLGKVSWQEVSTDDQYGTIDIAKSIENYKGSVMYLTTEFVSPRDQALEIRLGTPNAWKLWVNGELQFAREEYHRGTSLDQYRVAVRFRKGRNVILLKLLQNEQTQDWAQRYQVQLRVCNATGGGVNSVEP